jgi:hypothetical protein
MTWIVGGPGLAAPFLAGDICITFTHADGRQETRDCLCKIYAVVRASGARLDLTRLVALPAKR